MPNLTINLINTIFFFKRLLTRHIETPIYQEAKTCELDVLTYNSLIYNSYFLLLFSA